MTNKVSSLKAAGKINRAAIDFGFTQAKPGLSLFELDQLLNDFIIDSGGQPAFKNYLGFPGSACLSLNSDVIHGTPRPDVIIKDGDLLTIDIGTKFNGWCVDSADTKQVGTIDIINQQLIIRLNDLLFAQLSVLKDGCSLLDIASVGNVLSKAHNYNIFPLFGGHQIGENIHLDPFIPNCCTINEYKQYASTFLEEGQAVCIEPVITYGSTDIFLDSDGWTYKTTDGKNAAHIERCVIITKNGYELLC